MPERRLDLAAKRAMIGATGFAATASLADWWELSSSVADSGEQSAILRLSFLWSIALALALLAAVEAIAAIADGAVQRGVPPLAAATGAALPLGTAVAWLGVDILSGPGAARSPWIGAMRAVAIGAPFLAFAAGNWIRLKVLRRAGPAGSSAFARAFAALGLVLIAAVPFADARLHRERYPSFHLLAWLVVALSWRPVVSFLLTWMPRRAAFATTVGAVLFAAALAWSAPSLDDLPRGRALASGRTLVLRQVVHHLLPAPERNEEIDLELLARLRAQSKADPDLLDRAIPGRRSFNVVLLSVDALRADRLGRAGYPRQITPNIDAFLAQSVEFTAAWSTYPATALAFASLFSGIYPSGTDYAELLWSTGNRLEERRQPTLPGILSKRGWRTEAVTGMPAGPVLSKFPHLKTGFEYFDAHQSKHRGDRDIDAPILEEYLLQAVDRDDPRPFCVWSHFFDPHQPYTPAGPHVFGESDVDLYDAEVLYADRSVGRILEALEERGRLRDSIVVLFSDHGQEFGERGRTGHASSVAEAQIHVPLGIFVPGVAPRRIDSPVDLTDILPTMLELLAIPPPRVHGQSLVPQILGGDATEGADWAFAEVHEPTLFVGSRQFAIRKGRWKLWEDVSSRSLSLFDLAEDPDEREDLAEVRDEDLAGLRVLLDTVRRYAASDPDDTDPSAESTSALARPSAGSILESLGAGNDESKLHALAALVVHGCPDELVAEVGRLAEESSSGLVRRRAARALGGRPKDAPASGGSDAARLDLLGRIASGADGSAALEAWIAAARLGRTLAGEAPSRRPEPDSDAEVQARQRLRFTLWESRRAGGSVDAATAGLAADRIFALLDAGDLGALDAEEAVTLLAHRRETRLVDHLVRWLDEPEDDPIVARALASGRLDVFGEEALARLRRGGPARTPARPDQGPDPAPAPAGAILVRDLAIRVESLSRPMPGSPLLLAYEIEAAAGGRTEREPLTFAIAWIDPEGAETILRSHVPLPIGPPIEPGHPLRGAARVEFPRHLREEGRLVARFD